MREGIDWSVGRELELRELRCALLIFGDSETTDKLDAREANESLDPRSLSKPLGGMVGKLATVKLFPEL